MNEFIFITVLGFCNVGSDGNECLITKEMYLSTPQIVEMTPYKFQLCSQKEGTKTMALGECSKRERVGCTLYIHGRDLIKTLEHCTAYKSIKF